MARTSLTESPPPEFTADEQESLLLIAYQSIRSGLDTRRAAEIDVAAYPPRLSAKRASFVTLQAAGKLRGCIGSLEPRMSLVADVSHNAYAAAFRDPRFPPLRTDEISTLSVQVSVLSVPTLLDFESPSTLLAQLRPGIDGLILQERALRSTFLPSVWESLPDPERFLEHLKLKAGLPVDYWSTSIRFWRYTTESFAAGAAAIRGKSEVHRPAMPK
jgi:AmmeMemoRadiSam system protein A